MRKIFNTLFLVIIACVLAINFAFTNKDEKEESINRGENIYIFNCINCHMADGKGEAEMYPPLAGSDFLMGNINKSIQMTMLGSEGGTLVNGKTYNMAMDPIYISDAELADVMNYVLNSWGNTSNELITVERVNSLR